MIPSFFFLLISIAARCLLGSCLLVLSLHSTWASTSEGTGKREIDVLLRINSHHERWDVDNLPPNPDMLLSNKHTSMVDRLGHSRLEYKGLQPAFKEVFNSQSQDIIELVLALVQKPIPVHSSEKGFTLKDSTRVLLIQSQKFPGSITDAAQSILHPPQLPFTTEPILSHQLQLVVQSLLLIWTARLLEGLPV